MMPQQFNLGEVEDRYEIGGKSLEVGKEGQG